MLSVILLKDQSYQITYHFLQIQLKIKVIGFCCFRLPPFH